MGAAISDRVRRAGRSSASSWTKAHLHARHFAKRYRAELATGGALLLGWSLLTLAIASRSGWWEVWPASYGILLLSLCGWGWLRTLFASGLYVLSRGRGNG